MESAPRTPRASEVMAESPRSSCYPAARGAAGASAAGRDRRSRDRHARDQEPAVSVVDEAELLGDPEAGDVVRRGGPRRRAPACADVVADRGGAGRAEPQPAG